MKLKEIKKVVRQKSLPQWSEASIDEKIKILKLCKIL